jgi:hypothetical protein
MDGVERRKTLCARPEVGQFLAQSTFSRRQLLSSTGLRSRRLPTRRMRRSARVNRLRASAPLTRLLARSSWRSQPDRDGRGTRRGVDEPAVVEPRADVAGRPGRVMPRVKVGVGDNPSKTFSLHPKAYDTNCQCTASCIRLIFISSRCRWPCVWKPDDILPTITPTYVMKVSHIPIIAY